MADINGSFSGIVTSRVYPYVTYSYTQGTDGTGPYSDVTVTLYFKSVSAYYGFGTSSNTTTKVDGDVNHGSIAFNVAAHGTDNIVGRTKRVYHNTDGTKTTYIGASGSTNLIWGTYSFGQNVTLPAITRTTAVTSTAASSVGGTSATVGGTVTDAGLPPCSDRGVYWGTSSGSQPTKLSSGSGAGAFTANITGLDRGTQYFFKAFSYNTSYGYKYGSVLNFTTTADVPTVTTAAASGVGVSSATLGGNVTDDQGSAVTEKGVCYNTTGSPTIADDTESMGTGEGSFSEEVTGLDPDTTYYAKAYATNGEGTSYGSEISFTTLTAEPDVTTSSTVTLITTSGATVNGEVVSDSGSTVTERGFVYNTSGNPTTADSKKTVTGTTGAYSGAISGLTPGTKIYYKAYATNAEGTGYGDQEDFTTLPGNPSGLSATQTSKSTVDLTWTKGTAGTYTIIRRGETAPANINSGDLVYQGTGTSVTDTGLDTGTLYYYRAWSATTADWSVAYSASYSADSATTYKDFTDISNLFADDSNYAAGESVDGKLYAVISKDGGSTWSTPKSLTFTGSVTTQSFGTGETELWGLSWMGDDVDDANLRLKIYTTDETITENTLKTAGFSLTDTYNLTGVNISVKGAYTAGNVIVYYVKADPQYGDSPLPVGAGSLAYDTDEDAPTYYDGTNWNTLAISNDLPTGDVVGTTDTQTLTNKTIDADDNTISNLEVDNLKASAVVTESEGIPDNDNDTTLPTSAAVKDLVDSGILYGKNRQAIINGNFDIWQRGTSFTATGYTADRWYLYEQTGETVTVTRQAFTVGQTDVPNNPIYYLRYARTAKSGNPGFIAQKIEDVNTFAGQTVSVGCWIKSSTDTVIYANFEQQYGTGGSSNTYSSSQSFNIGTSWTYATFTLDVPSISGKTVGAGSSTMLYLQEWSNTSITLEFAQVQVNLGSEVLPYCHRGLGEELALCQRYYETSAQEGNLPSAGGYGGYALGQATTTSRLEALAPFCVRKRVDPAMTVWSYSGAVNKVSNMGTGYGVTGTTVTIATGGAGSNMNGKCRAEDSGGGFTVGTWYGFHWSADAEL